MQDYSVLGQWLIDEVQAFGAQAMSTQIQVSMEVLKGWIRYSQTFLNGIPFSVQIM